MIIARLDKSGYNCPSWYFMIISSDHLVGLRLHGSFHTGDISHCHQQWVSKGSVYLNIPTIGRLITIWNEVFFKLRVSFDGLVIRKKVFKECSHRIDIHIDVFVEVIELYISVAFDLCIDDYFIELWWAYLTFENPHATNLCRISTIHWWIPPVIRYHSGSILCLWWIFLVCWVFWNVSLNHRWFDGRFDHWFKVFCEVLFFKAYFCLLDSIVACLMSNC